MWVYWDTILAELKMVELLEIDVSKPELIAESIIQQKPDANPIKIAQAIGSLALFHSIGANGIKGLFAKNHPRTIKRLLDDCKSIMPNAPPRWLAIKAVEKQLLEFNPISMTNYYTATSEG